MSRPLTVRRPQVIITDVEGTTTDSSYFGSHIVPYVRENSTRFVEDTLRDNRSTKDAVDKFTQDCRSGRFPIPRHGSDRDIARAVEDNLLDQIDNKFFTQGTMALILLISMDGYSSGRLKCHMYDEVAAAFYFWKESLNIDICPISGGIPEVLKLRFTFSVDGCLDTLVHRYFSTDDIGSKRDRNTFHRLERELNVRSRDALFLTDDPREAAAARESNWTAILVSREGRQFEEERDCHGVITAFDQLAFN